MQAVTLTPLCLPLPLNLFVFCPFLLFFNSCAFSCFLPFKFFPRFLPPSCFLLFDFFLQELLPFLHFLLLPSCFAFLLPFRCLRLRFGTASLCTSWCLSPSTLASISDETISLLLTLWELADTDMRSGRSPRRRRRTKWKGGVQWCFMVPGKGQNIICKAQNKTCLKS